MEVQVNSTDIQSEESNELLAGKYKTTEDLVSAYKELEKKLGSSASEGNQEDTPTETTDEPSSNQESKPSETPPSSNYGEGITSALSNAGLDVEAISKQFYSADGLDGETKGKLNELFGEEVVTAYLAGLESLNKEVSYEAEQAANKVLEVVGGEESWKSISQWAGTDKAPEAVVTEFNNALDSNDSNRVQVASMALLAAYQAMNGKEPSTNIRSLPTAQSSTAKGFADNSEMIAAMRDKRYSTSAAYREEVGRRLAASSFMS